MRVSSAEAAGLSSSVHSNAVPDFLPLFLSGATGTSESLLDRRWEFIGVDLVSRAFILFDEERHLRVAPVRLGSFSGKEFSLDACEVRLALVVHFEVVVLDKVGCSIRRLSAVERKGVGWSPRWSRSAGQLRRDSIPYRFTVGL